MWAQDKTRVFVTIKLQDVQNEEIIFQPTHFVFRGQVRSPEVAYDYSFELFEEVDTEHPETKYSKFGRYLQLNLRKRDAAVWWPRLAKTMSKLHHVRIDWEKWVDDDEPAPLSSKQAKKAGAKSAKTESRAE
jgi:hypothetical protein